MAAAKIPYFADPNLAHVAVPIETLDLDPDNEIDHTPESVMEIVALLRRFGWREAVHAGKSRRKVKTVTRGNRTLMAARWLVEAAASEDPEDRAQAMGHESWWSSDDPPDWLMVPALFFADDKATRVAWRISHNHSAAKPAWNWERLSDNMADVSDEIDWGDLGWSADELAELFDEDSDVVDGEDPDGVDAGGGPGNSPDPEPPIPDLPREPVTKLGEVIQLGDHVLHCADCMDVMAGMADNSVDFIGTDGPYGLSPDGKARTWDEIEVLRAEGKGPTKGFLGKAWDAGVPGVTWARECLRILKPGGHLVSFSATRTYHRHACAVEDAGFEIRDMFDWLQWQGFPKSKNVSAAIDEALGREREVVGSEQNWGGASESTPNAPNGEWDITAAASDIAAKWDGFGTALKSAKEPAVVARKPLDSIAPAEVAELLGQSHMWNRKALDSDEKRESAAKRWTVEIPEGAVEWRGRPLLPDVEGRLELRVGDDVIASLPGPKYSKAAISTVAANVLKWGTGAINIDAGRMAEGDPAWPGPQEDWDVPNPGADASFFPGASGRSGAGRSDTRSSMHDLGRWPANIYATPKPATSEKQAGCEDVDRKHETVKPTKLFVQLLRLFCPPGGTAFEPFGGSGTTLVAACGLDCKVILSEREPGYMDIIRARGAWALEQAAPKPRKPGKRRVAPRDGDKRQARRTIQTMVENGTLDKPSDLKCVDCKDAPAAEYDHHLGYAAAHHEDVEAVCSKCHHAREAKRTGAKTPA